MSSEFELLDHLQCENYCLAFLTQLFETKEQFNSSVKKMLKSGDIRMIDSAGFEVAKWKWRELLNEDVDKQVEHFLSITKQGAKYV